MSARRLLLLVAYPLAAWAQPMRLPEPQATPQPVYNLDRPIGAHSEVPPPEVLMAQVRAQLPPQPIRMTGQIETRHRKTKKKLVRLLESDLRFGESVPHAVYHLRDAFGSPVASARVEWNRGLARYTLLDVEGQETDARPQASDDVAETGITWSDLSLAFLWWPGATFVYADVIRTRECFVMLIPAPEDFTAARSVRVWIDSRARFVVKAELLDQDGEVLKRIEVDSIKEIAEDVWMVKDVDVRDYANDLRIAIRIDEVLDLSAPPEAAEED